MSMSSNPVVSGGPGEGAGGVALPLPLDRKLTWLRFFMLTVCTFGLYEYFWLMDRAEAFSTMAKGKGPTRNTGLALLALCIVSWVLQLVGLFGHQPGIRQVGIVVGVVLWVKIELLAFSFLRDLRAHAATQGVDLRYSRILAFLFTLWYVQERVEFIRNGKKTHFVLFASLLLLIPVGLGVVASLMIPSLVAVKDRAKESMLEMNVHEVQMALVQYSLERAGAYPQTALLTRSLAPLAKDGLLGSVPSPWSGKQVSLIDARAAGLGLWNHPTPAGEDLGAGMWGGTIQDIHEYGAIAYASDGKHYVLYGIGKKGNDAVVDLALKD